MDRAADCLAPLLGGLTNYERQHRDRPRWTLDTMRALLARPGAALPPGPLVQVGGSKGKGTTCLYLEALARDAGLSVGTYLSPHLETVLERIRLAGRPVSLGRLHRVLRLLLDHCRTAGLDITFFEVMTAAAVACFAEEAVDLGLLEVGLGGRLDATTAVPVAASVLTGVELEHTSILGDTLEAIAGEKAHVVRAGGTAFTAATGPALGVFHEHAGRVGATLQVIERDFRIEQLDETGEGFRGVVVTRDRRPRRFFLPGAARFELRALVLAVACLDHLFPDRQWSLDPVPRPELPGRFEVLALPDGHPLVLDAAHTGESAAAVATEVGRRFPGARPTVLFACGAQKRWQACLSALLPVADRFLVTGLVGTEFAEPAQILDWLRGEGARADAVPDAATGLQALLASRGPRLVTGSFYLAGAVRSLLREETLIPDASTPAASHEQQAAPDRRRPLPHRRVPHQGASGEQVPPADHDAGPG